jgi:hypothetical protein
VKIGKNTNKEESVHVDVVYGVWLGDLTCYITENFNSHILGSLLLNIQYSHVISSPKVDSTS